ncbi:phosphocholine cytidylyltransferase family protein (plasmid) [Tistrella bauzanensis]|jgi:NDP-sugar pyrophosphorylase family protein|uniref:Phosphocholine cytidylyltransferase family protein n=1 Tax=Tistrella arctica TaxID=3133430 RepID=A0ABU9YL52_9PROT
MTLTATPINGAPRGPTRAVILAAGLGSRLRPYTDSIPKPLVPVAGRPMLINALDCLHAAGVREVVIVTGYRGEQVRAAALAHGRRLDNDNGQRLDIRFVDAPDYSASNNSVSLWQARAHLDRDLFLIEGDVMFDRHLLPRLIAAGPGSVTAVAPFLPPMSGSTVAIDHASRVLGFRTRMRAGEPGTGRLLKTINIHLLRQDFLQQQLVPALAASVAGGHVTAYVEEVMDQALTRGMAGLRAVSCQDLPWFEVDDAGDLETANQLFRDVA